MNNYQVVSPILFLGFNRPETARKVFEAISNVKPRKLYIALDGPRKGNLEDIRKSKLVKEIFYSINWDCEIKTLYRDENLGCKYAVSSAINWFFECEEEGIILEDDCLPGDDFFVFCDELLEKYRHDTRIMHIGGTNFHVNKQCANDSYYFSNLCNVWGWASWRNTWKNYDVELSKYANIDAFEKFNIIFNNKIIAESWVHILKKLLSNGINTWDYQWTITIMLNNGLTIMPNENLIKNIGFGIDATHTVDVNSKIPNNELGTIGTIVHPSIILPEKKLDIITLKREFRYNKMKKKKMLNKLKFWKIILMN